MGCAAGAAGAACCGCGAGAAGAGVGCAGGGAGRGPACTVPLGALSAKKRSFQHSGAPGRRRVSPHT
ncbi:MAG: hypothetical protein E6I75_04750 [Chloroflexi bacterium]|nr:MAG: hypothetical protein E6I75_04750 [Chloroflexota bacterium]